MLRCFDTSSIFKNNSLGFHEKHRRRDLFTKSKQLQEFVRCLIIKVRWLADATINSIWHNLPFTLAVLAYIMPSSPRTWSHPARRFVAYCDPRTHDLTVRLIASSRAPVWSIKAHNIADGRIVDRSSTLMGAVAGSDAELWCKTDCTRKKNTSTCCTTNCIFYLFSYLFQSLY